MRGSTRRGRGGGGADAYPLARLAGADDRARHPRRPRMPAAMTSTRALVLHPDDLLFRALPATASRPSRARWRGNPSRAANRRCQDGWRMRTTPSGRRHRAARMQRDSDCATRPARPDPDFAVAARRAARGDADTDTRARCWTRHPCWSGGCAIASARWWRPQVVEDEGAKQLPRGHGNYHRLNAMLKRVTAASRARI